MTQMFSTDCINLFSLTTETNLNVESMETKQALNRITISWPFKKVCLPVPFMRYCVENSSILCIYLRVFQQ